MGVLGSNSDPYSHMENPFPNDLSLPAKDRLSCLGSVPAVMCLPICPCSALAMGTEWLFCVSSTDFPRVASGPWA